MIQLVLFIVLLPFWVVPGLYTGGYWFKHSINKLKAELVPGQTLTGAEISDAQLSAFMLGFFWPAGLVAIVLRHPAMKAIEAGARLADTRDVQLIQLADPHYRAALEEIHKEYPAPSLGVGYIDADYKENELKTSRRWA